MCQSQETGAQVGGVSVLKSDGDLLRVCKACHHCLKDFYMDGTDISVTLVSTAISCVPVKSFSVSSWRAID